MNTFVNTVARDINNEVSRTENGMKAWKTSSSAVLDLFGKIGAARNLDITGDFARALNEDVNLALRTLLWVRDIRGGAGERKTFRNLLTYLDKTRPEVALAIMHKIPELGRWDDLFSYESFENRKAAMSMIQKALAEGNALCAKWMPRKGPRAVMLTKFLGMTPKQYRKTIVGLSATVEQYMSQNKWEEINFSHVPSRASSLYQKAFGRHVPELYGAYLAELQKPQEKRDPKVKINAGAIFPHDIVANSLKNGSIAASNAQWEALPDYLDGTSILPMVDTSGSMTSWYSPRPIDVALALGLYTSSRNKSAFKDLFLTFSARPHFQRTAGTLSDRLRMINMNDWDQNTDLNAAMDLILKTAISGHVPAEDMPSILLILSDMQFDASGTRFYRSGVGYDETAIEMTRRKYADAGYEMPRVVYWNLRATSNTPVKFDDRGICMVSGFSPSIMEAVLANDLEDYTPYNVMLKKLMNPRYNF